MVTVTATDGETTASIDVTVTVTDVNEVPEFAGATAEVMVAESTAAGENIGAPVAATDADEPLTYALRRLVGVRGRHGGADVLARCRALSNHDLRSGAGELWGFIHVSHRDCHIDAGRGFAVGGGYGDHVAGLRLVIQGRLGHQLTRGCVDIEGAGILAAQTVSQRLVLGVGGLHRGADVLARCRVLSNHDLRSGAGELWGFIHVSHRDGYHDAGRGFAVGGGYGDHVAGLRLVLHGHRNRHRRRNHGQHRCDSHGD